MLRNCLTVYVKERERRGLCEQERGRERNTLLFVCVCEREREANTFLNERERKGRKKERGSKYLQRQT